MRAIPVNIIWERSNVFKKQNVKEGPFCVLQYDPSRALFSEIRLIEKKPMGGLISKSSKYAFQFQQSRLSYYKDIRVGLLKTAFMSQIN